MTEKNRAKTLCSCRQEVLKRGLTKHQQTKKHQEALNNLNNINNNASTESDKEKKFKQNRYEEIRKLVEDNEGNEVVKEVKAKKKQAPENKYSFKLFD